MDREEAIKEFEYGIISDEAVKSMVLEQKSTENFESTKDHILKLAGDYKCWDNRLTHDEALELCHMLEQEPCEDCVSRKKIEKLKRWRFSYDTNTTIPKSDLFVRLTDIRDLPSVTPTQKWIPVSERLPKESLNSVIGWDAYRERCVFGQFIDGHFQITGKNESFNIIAWQPLPKPYKAD